MSESTDLRPITFERERAKFLSEISIPGFSALGLTQDHYQLHFSLKRVAGEILHFVSVSPSSRALKIGESLQLAFGLEDGQYFLNTKIENIQLNDIMVSFRQETELSCLQRRNTLRSAVPMNSGLKFALVKIGSQILPKPFALNLVDLSAGGFRADWPTLDLGEPAEGLAVGGVLTSGPKKLELFGLLKTVHRQGHEVQVGAEFQSLSTRDEQALLFICMRLRGK